MSDKQKKAVKKKAVEGREAEPKAAGKEPAKRKPVKKKKGKIENMDSGEDEGFAYAQKRYTHTIAVDFNGKTYEVTADVLLRRKLGPADEPYIVNSSLSFLRYQSG